MSNPDGVPFPLAMRPVSRITFLRIGGVAALGATLPGVWSAVAAGADPSDAISVDLADRMGEPTYAATGFLHGLSGDGSSPPDSLLRPLKPQLFRGGGSALPGGGWSAGGYAGYAVRWETTLRRYQRVSTGPYNAEYCIVLSDLWGAEGVSLKPTDPYPGDDGDWSNWEQFLAQVVSDVRAARMRADRVQYEIWNEPDFGNVYFPRPKEQYEQMWRRGVRAIRDLDNRARIVGPTFTRLAVTGPSWRMDEWLDMVTASGTAPDILSWHDLIPGRDPVDQADLARALLAERGLAQIRLEINEYPSSGGLDPGYNTWYVARLQRARIDYAALAIYGQCCTFPQLDGLLTQEGEELFRTGRWWAYQRYAGITGELVRTHPGRLVDAVAGIDRARGQARILLGNERGDGTNLGTVRVTLSGDGMARGVLTRSGRVRTRLERIRDRAKLDRTEVVREQDLRWDQPALTIDVPWPDASSAYVVTLGVQDDELPPYVIVEATPPELVLLPGEPSTVELRLRNYTDEALSLPAAVTVPSGYTATVPDSVAVPANGDADLTVTVVRSTADTAPTQLVVNVGTQSLTVALQPSDDWVRIAAMSASSTHAPSSPANLNDGDTDPERWGGGGAGGWNDDTLGVFPDTVTATWPHPVRISRVRVHTLNSVAFPASQWGVRDVDLIAVVGGVPQTLAQIRGNVAGVLESRFAAVDADALVIQILDSNSHDYSRLLEVEAFTS